MRKWLVVGVVLFGLAVAGCSVPGLGDVTAPHVAKSAVEDPAVTPTCRSALAAVPGGSDLANATDVRLGGAFTFRDPDAERAQALVDLASSASTLGVAVCP